MVFGRTSLSHVRQLIKPESARWNPPKSIESIDVANETEQINVSGRQFPVVDHDSGAVWCCSTGSRTRGDCGAIRCRRWQTPVFVYSRQIFDRYVERLSEPSALTEALNWYRANAKPVPPADAPPDPPAVACPVMGVLAEDDAYLLEPQFHNSMETIHLIEGSWRYETVADASHWLTVDGPRATTRLLVDFLTDQRGGRSDESPGHDSSNQ